MAGLPAHVLQGQRPPAHSTLPFVWLLAFCVPPVLLFTWLVAQKTQSLALVLGAFALSSLGMAWASAIFLEQLIRPLQTLANIVVALREEDFSLRVRGGRRGDALGDLALEINLLAATLQSQRLRARDAVSLAERVMATMPTPVFAFAPSSQLRLLNDAAAHVLACSREDARGRTAAELGLVPLLALPDGGVFDASSLTLHPPAAGQTPYAARWSVHRAEFRLEGLPHQLLVLSDVAAALREEERVAWQRLIRVLGHEINNSLAPISSIAGSLRARLQPAAPGVDADLHRGLLVIEDRAGALHRFLLAYQRLSRLPAPHFRPVPLIPLLEQLVQMETRLPVYLEQGEPLHLRADPDQLQQLLINLVRNGVEAALQPDRPREATAPFVGVSWHRTAGEVVLQIRDNGPGLANPHNLFVPFYTTKPEGSGIGLVLAQQIAMAHGGSVRLVQRPEGHGCDAFVHLPQQLS